RSPAGASAPPEPSPRRGVQQRGLLPLVRRAGARQAGQELPRAARQRGAAGSAPGRRLQLPRARVARGPAPGRGACGPGGAGGVPAAGGGRARLRRLRPRAQARGRPARPAEAALAPRRGGPAPARPPGAGARL
ncbi:unnamed protein product, partial [Prorocentrum cordatum]